MVTTEQQVKRANAHLLAWKSIDSNKTCDIKAFPSVADALHFAKGLSLLAETHVLVTGTSKIIFVV